MVVGGSFAGVASAAALGKIGFDVLLLEPGLADHKRLAGELIQAPGVEALAEIGLLDRVWAAGAVPSCGFAILADSVEPAILSYAETAGCYPTGLAIEHSVLARALLDAAHALPNVTVKKGRAMSVIEPDASSAEVRYRDEDGEHVVRARLVVAADGRGSKTREAAGIGVTRSEAFRMLGCKLPNQHLPFEGYGHVFVGGKRPVLCYRVASDALRIMFELSHDATELKMPDEADLAVLPPGIAAAVRREFAEGRGISAMVFGLTPEAAARGRVALVGDSGGCVHPITATGVSFCFKDAALLARVVAAKPYDIPRALEAYSAARARPMQTRAMLGPLLAAALGDEAPEMQLLRRGLFRYWHRDRKGRGASMGLLSTHESRALVLALEYAKVAAYALVGLLDGPRARPLSLGAALALGKRAAQVTMDSVTQSRVLNRPVAVASNTPHRAASARKRAAAAQPSASA